MDVRTYSTVLEQSVPVFHLGVVTAFLSGAVIAIELQGSSLQTASVASPLRRYDGIGRRAGFRFLCSRVGVRVPLPAPLGEVP